MPSMSRTLQLTEQLIAAASVTPRDAGCQDLIRQRLQAVGFECESLLFGEGELVVSNLWAIGQQYFTNWMIGPPKAVAGVKR